MTVLLKDPMWNLFHSKEKKKSTVLFCSFTCSCQQWKKGKVKLVADIQVIEIITGSLKVGTDVWIAFLACCSQQVALKNTYNWT